MARTRVRWGRVAGLGVGICLAVTVAAGAASAGSSDPRGTVPAQERVHVVRSGDTIWSIAERVVGPEGDPRAVVDLIVQRNGVSGAIQPGQRLVVPA